MVISQIHSGLGNQMFQYAAGKSLATHLNTNLLLDITWFDNSHKAQTPNDYQLNQFTAIHEKFADRIAVDRLIRPSSKGILNRIKHKINRNRPPHLQWAFVEPHFHYYKDFFNAKAPVYLSGYWQSEKYFGQASEEIRKIFSIDINQENVNYELSKFIKSVNAVSIHVRRGDMVNNPLVVATHGSCNLEYYLKAMKLIETDIGNPHYFVFSDDPDWCKENLTSRFPLEFVSGNSGFDAYLDIQLMRQCEHHIIANSSFSWWGAWLNPSVRKRVIAPKRWFAKDDRDTSDLIPADWIRI